MIDASYSEAAVEVLDILEHTKKEEVEKISKRFIEALENIKSKTYQSTIDYSKGLKNADLLHKTKVLLSIIYFRYWANRDEKKSFIENAQKNEIEFQKEMREKYNPDNIFKNNKKIKV